MLRVLLVAVVAAWFKALLGPVLEALLGALFEAL